MIFRSKAPLRLGLAGGGTDVSPYSDIYGGGILNVTISLYAYASIEVLDEDSEITIAALDRGEREVYPVSKKLPITGTLDLAKAVYNKLIEDFKVSPRPFRLSTFVDAPAGSGLGSSSTLVVAIIGAFCEWLKIPMGEYDIASYAYYIERQELKMEGGKQDQYAATFGGVNFMEFYADDKVIVNPLNVKDYFLAELEHNLLLFYTKTSRLSSEIIRAQSQNVREKNTQSIDAMHALKEQAKRMKDCLLRGEIDEIGPLLHSGFEHKKQMAAGISNHHIDSIYRVALDAGATGGKISGAGGGGFMMFYCPGVTKYAVMKALEKFGHIQSFRLEKKGLQAWFV